MTKIAFVHCWIMPGGALEVFKDLIRREYRDHNDLLDAKAFTLFSDRKYLQVGNHALPVITALPSWINQLFLFCTNKKIGILSWIFDYRNLMFFYRMLMRKLSRKIKRYVSGHDKNMIVISSFAVAKNITPVSSIPTKLYLHSPMQYIWSHHDEYGKKLHGIKKKIFDSLIPKLRKWDKKYTKFDKVYANSQYTANLANELYHMKAEVSYPRIDEAFFHKDVCEEPLEYYVYVGRLVAFVKECDLIIKLFNKLNKPLIMIGSGPDEAYLKSIAHENITFPGRKSPEEISSLIRKAKGLINLTRESFGMNTAEALLLGVPVFGYNAGATPDLVSKECGILIDSKDNFHDIVQQFHKFDEKQWNRKQIALHIRRKLGVRSV